MGLFVHKKFAIMEKQHKFGWKDGDANDPTNHGSYATPSASLPQLCREASDMHERNNDANAPTKSGISPQRDDDCEKKHAAHAGQESLDLSPSYLKCLRKRNAIYSKRKYYKNKMYHEELQRTKDELKGINHKLRSENQQLEDLVQRAKDKVIIQARRQEMVEKLLAQQVQRQQQQLVQMRGRLTQSPMASGYAFNMPSPSGRSSLMRNAASLQQQVTLQHPLSSVPVPPSQRDVVNDFASRRTSALVEQALLQQRQQQHEMSQLFLQLQVPPALPTVNTMQMRRNTNSNELPSPLLHHNGPLTSDAGTGGRLIRAIEAAQSMNHNGMTSQGPYRTPFRDNDVAVKLQRKQAPIKSMDHVTTTTVAPSVQHTSTSKNQPVSTVGLDIDLSSILEQYKAKRLLEATTLALIPIGNVTTTAADLMRPEEGGLCGRSSNPCHGERMLSKIVNAGPASSPDALMYAHLALQQGRKHKS